MCGIAGILPSSAISPDQVKEILLTMNRRQKHRGPDGEGLWVDSKSRAGLAHVRLSIIDLASGAQPMQMESGTVISFNGEIYNYLELREELGAEKFKTRSDTEVILRAYEKWGTDCVTHLRGMFAFAIFDPKTQTLFLARDRFGIKPLYYAETKYGFVFASEAKTILPFLERIETDMQGLKDYLTFQFVLENRTLFRGIHQLGPAHRAMHRNGALRIERYWEVQYKLDWFHTKDFFKKEIRVLLEDSIRFHLRSDVPVGSYLSGGVDSSIVATLAKRERSGEEFQVFTGKFTDFPGYDETSYARAVAEQNRMRYHECTITAKNFTDHIRKVIYHLDYPIAGPGSFPQYMISQMASKHLKVVLGGQGGDEIFGGYVRYLVSYFEQCIKGAIEDQMKSATGKFVVTYESIIPNLKVLNSYKPLLQEFWREGLFESRDKRYFRLINRSGEMNGVIDWNRFDSYSPFEAFKELFWGKNVEPKSYFDSMTHFDFKTLLPALLHVEDRMSMAHGLESRVPLLDHPLVELAATIPSNIKFEEGHLKHLPKITFSDLLPESLNRRTDKMGFPVPLTEWLQGELQDFVGDIFSSKKAGEREYLHPDFNVKSLISKESRFGRKVWGLLSLELWQQEFHDHREKHSL